MKKKRWEGIEVKELVSMETLEFSAKRSSSDYNNGPCVTNNDFSSFSIKSRLNCGSWDGDFYRGLSQKAHLIGKTIIDSTIN